MGGSLTVQGHVAYPHLADNPVHRALTDAGQPAEHSPLPVAPPMAASSPYRRPGAGTRPDQLPLSAGAFTHNANYAAKRTGHPLAGVVRDWWPTYC
jgi:hypothetical protein